MALEETFGMQDKNLRDIYNAKDYLTFDALMREKKDETIMLISVRILRRRS